MTAAIDPGDGSDLVYAHVGDSVGPARVLGIDAHGVRISVSGQERRLELPP